MTTCGDITTFSVDSTTGRLSYVLNSQVTAASGAPLPYFPVPANPIDFVISSKHFPHPQRNSGNRRLGLSPTPTTLANGQLTINQNSSQPLGITQGTAIVVAGGVIYVLDNGPNTNSPASNGQIFAYSLGAGGALQAEPTAIFPTTRLTPIRTTLSPQTMERWLYVLNEGDNTNTTNAQSGIAAFTITTPYQLSPIPANGVTQIGGTGAGPQCILEDPSNQFIYTANFNSSTVTGLSIDQNDGNLTPLSQQTKAKDSYTLPGPATWCIVTGRTS